MRLSAWLGAMALSLCFGFPAQPHLGNSSASLEHLGGAYSRRMSIKVDGDEDGQGTGPQTRDACGARDMDKNFAIFGFLTEEKFTGATISRRMELPNPADAGAIAQYVMKQMPKAIDIYHIQGVNTATYFPFDLSQNPIKKSQRTVSIGIDHLCGCTALVVVSRKGAYVAHYFEDISFSPSDDTKQIWGTDNQVTFQKTCIDGLNDGLPCTNVNDIFLRRPDQEPLKKHAEDLKDGTAFIIRPSNGQRGGVNPYNTKIAAIKNEIRLIIPTITISTPDIFYVAASDDEKKDDVVFLETARGKLLLRWTPTQDKTNKNAPPNLVKIWSETTEIYSDAW